MTDSSKPKPVAKQVIYIDVDDEITTVIDKVNAADARVVALVLPKRAGVFQSVVNMKLLKRRAEAARKHLVLVTSEPSLMPLAGMAGLHVAPTPQSKPEIPASTPVTGDDDDGVEPLDDEPDFDPGQKAGVPVGALAAGSGAAGAGVIGPSAASSLQDGDTIELDNTSKRPKVAPAATSAPAKTTLNVKKDKNPKVPDFLRFRKRLILGGLLVVLLAVGWYFAFTVMPKATVTIRTNSSDIDGKLAITLDADATEVDTKGLILPAETKQEQKTATQQVPATGQQNNGEKAGGEVKLSLSDCSQNSLTIPAGTGLSTNGLTFITQASATLSSVKIGGTCKNSDFPTISSASVEVIAQKGGANYNVGASTFTGAPAGVTATSSDAMEGGTDNIVKIVQQSDLDAAEQKIKTASENTIKIQLKEKLEDDRLYPVSETFFASTPNISTSSKVGDEAENITVTSSVTYSMFGVKKDELKQLIDADLKDKINDAKQSILDDGLADARITTGAPGAGPQVKIDVVVTAKTGPKLDVAKLKQDIVGMKSGEVKDRIKSTPGVDEVEVVYSPFWVAKAPKAEKITVQFEKTSAKGSADDQ